MAKRTSTRRRFLQSAGAGGAALGLGEIGLLGGLRPVSGAEARLDPGLVRFGEDIEPTVRFLEDTPRERILEEVVARIRKDLSYRELVAGMLLAGIRNIPGAELASHRNVGGELHSVFTIHSAHLASLASPERERWWPILWALDRIKRAQGRPMRGDGRRRPAWQMNPVDESAVPRKGKAREAFVAAMESWDEEAADPAAAGLARSCGPDEVFELLWQYGARDYRYIGHKSIFLANGWRTLQYAGWQHAEGVVRSLARAMTAYFHEQGHPNQTNQLADRSWRQNRKLATTIRAGWQSGKPDGGAGAAFSATLRRGSTAEASEAAVALLNREIGPQVIWDGVLNGVSELLMTWPGANMVHAVTTANAVHFAYQTSNSEETQKLLLLQAAAFVPLFRDDLGKGSRLQNVKQIEWLEPRPLDGGGKGAIEEIFAAVSEDPRAAAEKTLTYLRDQGDPQKIIDRARQLVFLKGDEYHDYKYSSAVLEDVGSISPEHRNRFLAASMFYLRGSGEPDTDLAKRIQAAV